MISDKEWEYIERINSVLGEVVNLVASEPSKANVLALSLIRTRMGKIEETRRDLLRDRRHSEVEAHR